MSSQFGKAVAIFLAICAFQSTALAGNANRLKVGIVITGHNDRADTGQRVVARFTCNAAKLKISMSGYKGVELLKCGGNIYQFSAQSHSRIVNINFDAITGQISII